MSHTSASTTNQTASSYCTLSTRQPPRAGFVIPNLLLELSDGTKRHRRDSWRDIVTRWPVGDPEPTLTSR